MLIGFWGMLRHRNILRIIIGFSLIDTGMHIVLVATGYVSGGTAPIVDEALGISDAAPRAVDPIPCRAGRDGHRHRLFGDRDHAVLRDPALRHAKTLSIDALTESKW